MNANDEKTAAAAREHAGALAWFQATVAGADDQALRQYEVRQFELRQELAEHLEVAPFVSVSPEAVRAARGIAEVVHLMQVDKVGAPYIGHPRRIAQRVADDPAAEATALLHDVLEDGPEHHPVEAEFVASMAVIAERVSPQVALAVHRLTRVPAVVGDAEYYAVVRSDPLALRVKLADIDDNTDPDRVARLDPALAERLALKYAKARQQLGG